ncbi:hypothetical protein BC628DRAFT_1414013 [Trametes gibbosa]|nr:hypothetical protein BC628DRAFT_1414013 [Trametes gibbosa]
MGYAHCARDVGGTEVCGGLCARCGWRARARVEKEGFWPGTPVERITAQAFGLWNAERTATELGFGAEGSSTSTSTAFEHTYIAEAAEEDAHLTDLLENFTDLRSGTNLPDETDRSARAGDHLDPKSPWFPYPNKTVFLLAVLDNLPRLRILDSLLKVFLWILKETGVRDVPSFNAFRKIQCELRQTCSVTTILCKSVQGNIFYMNDPRQIIAKDWANPMVRPHMHVYPEIPADGVISEIWHTEKWRKGMDVSILSPMFDSEWARLRDGRLIIPKRWVTYKGEVHAEAFVLLADIEVLRVDTSQAVLISASLLENNYHDLEALNVLPECSQWPVDFDNAPPAMPNPLRVLAGGDPLYSSFIDYFGDDVSGNRSKSWNKHWNTYMMHRNLPRRLLQQEFHTHFVSTSPHASVVEQFQDFKGIIEHTHREPVRVLDASTGKPARFRLFVNAEPSDNPMQSELSGHIGGGGNLPCRKCEVGGSNLDKGSDAGFHALFQPGDARNKENTLGALKHQVTLACLGVEKHVRDEQTCTGIKDRYTQFWIDQLLQRARDMKKQGQRAQDIQRELLVWVDVNSSFIYNPCLTLVGLDPSVDTPVEILHTILLGVVKYVWYGTHVSWDTKQKLVYAQRLQATNTDALLTYAIRAQYIMQYANSLIGRQLKTVVQATSFHVYDLLPSLRFKLWLAVGELTALLWFPEIHDLKVYLEDIDIAVANVLDLFAEIDPTKILEKIKLHLLVHVREDIKHFGPLIGVCSESFECFNAIFRLCSILSNHLAPSRDIAVQLADQEAHKHRLTSGWWPILSGDWVQASPAVRDFLHSQPMLQRLLGWTPEKPIVPGSFRPLPLPKGDMSRPRPGSKIIGKIDEILAMSEAAQHALVVLDIYEVSARRHPTYGMPSLLRRQDESLTMIVRSQDIQFAFNVQHDCALAKCTASGKRPVMQEHVESGAIESYIEHQDIAQYIINMHSLHNPHLIRSVLPRALTAPLALHGDCFRKHCQIAESLRETQQHKLESSHATAIADEDAGRSATQSTGQQPMDPQVDNHQAAPDSAAVNSSEPGGNPLEPSRKQKRA